MTHILFPLTLSQKDIYFDQIWHLNSPLYNVGGYVDIKHIEPGRMHQAHQRLIQSMEQFGLRVVSKDDNVYQYFSDQRTTALSDIDFSDKADPLAAANAWITELFETPMDYEDSELFRAYLVKLCDDHYWYVGLCHHLAMDGWGFSNWAKKLAALYNEPEADVSSNGAWQEVVKGDQDYQASATFEKNKQHWLSHLNPEPANFLPLNYRLSGKEPGKESGRENDITTSQRQILTLEKHTLEQLFACANRLNVNISHILLGVLSQYFSKAYQRDSIQFGVPFHNRKTAAQKEMLGMFVGICPFNVTTNQDLSLAQTITEIAAQQRKNLRHQRYPIGRMSSDLGFQGKQNQMYDIGFNYLKLNHQLVFGDAPAELVYLSHNHETTPLMVTAWEYGDGDGLELQLDFNEVYFRPVEIERLSARLNALFERCESIIDKPLSDIDLLPQSELLWLSKFHDNAIDFDQAVCIHQLFEQQAAQTPQNDAVVWQDQVLSYEQLNRQANQLAHHLIAQGVKPDALVALSVNRGLEMMVAIMAILKAGGAYVPLDPNYPASRISYMLKDSGARWILTESEVLNGLPVTNQQVVCLDDSELQSQLSQNSTDNPDANHLGLKSHHLSYMIYTSGSTGEPKGVMIEHSNVAALIAWAHHTFDKDSLRSVLASTSVNFDISVFEMFVPLATGGRVVVVENALSLTQAGNLAEIAELTLINTVPSAGKALLDADAIPDSVITINLAGELLEQGVVDRLYQKGIKQVFDLYGPSESTVYSTFKLRERGGRNSIGLPVNNTNAHVLDEQLNPVPVGVAGRLFLCGAGIGRGYHQQPLLTEERFISDTLVVSGGGRLYDTGDLVRHLPDGHLEYLGRVDNQVKIRGFRIELDEIAATLLTLDGVKDAVVSVHQQASQDKRLVAYIVSEALEGQALDGDVANEHKTRYQRQLQQLLPEFMVPAVYILLDALPLTPSGKIDRKQLPQPDANQLHCEQYVAPTTTFEQQLCEIWQDVLEINQVGVADNFFTLGGDSISSIQVVSRAKKLGYQLSVRDLFDSKTIAMLGTVVQESSGFEKVVANQAPCTGQLKLLPIQQAFFEQQLAQPHHYNQAVLLNVPEGFDVDALKQVVGALYQRHDALRLRFNGKGQRVEAFYCDYDASMAEQTVSLHTVDHLTVCGKQVTDLCQQVQQSLNYHDGPLFRAALIKPQDGADNSTARLLLAIHHLAVDGVSWRILLQDLLVAWQQIQKNQPVSLAAKTSAFQQWGDALGLHAEHESLSEVLSRAKAFWSEQHQQSVPELVLDSNSPRQYAQFELNEKQTELLLGNCNQTYRTRINELLLAALSKAYQQWNGSEALKVDIEGHGRESLFEHLDVSETVGWFTSIFPLVLNPTVDADLPTLIKQVKQQYRQLPDNGIGFGLLHYLAKDEEIIKGESEQGKANIEFNYLGQFDGIFSDSNGFKLASESPGDLVSRDNAKRVPVTVNAMVHEKRLQFSLDAQPGCQDINAFAALYQEVLEAFVEHCAQDGPDTVNCLTPSDFPLAKVDTATLEKITEAHPQISNLYVATPMQASFLFHALLDGSGASYTVQISCDISGQLNGQNMHKAWQSVVQRHEMLRTGFVGMGSDQIHQLVSKSAEIDFKQLDWSDALIDKPKIDREQRLQQQLIELRAADKAKGFDFEKPPLMRVTLVKLCDEKYHLVWSVHHAITDGWCTPILFGEVLKVYQALNQGNQARLPEIVPYENYIGWLNEQSQEKARDFWSEHLKGFYAPTPLMVDKLGDTKHVGIGTLNVQLDKDVSNKLDDMAKRCGCTVSVIVQAAWSYLLHRYSGESDVVFGATISGRPADLPGVEKMLGLFINSIPVRVRFDDELTVEQLLQTLHSDNVNREDHGYLPLVEIQNISDVPNGTDIFDSLIVFENFPAHEAVKNEIGRDTVGFDVDNIGFDSHSNYGLSITAYYSDKQLSADIRYQADRFSKAVMEDMWSHLAQTLTSMIERGEHQPVRDLALMTPAQTEQMLVEWNDTKVDYPTGLCVHQMIEQQVELHPDNEAVIIEGQSLTYQEFNEQANQLAHYLLAHGVKPDMRVGLSVERSLDMMVGLFGILKSGAAYVPLDPNYPTARLEYMLADSGVEIVVSQTQLLNKLPLSEQKVICLNDSEQLAALRQCDTTNVQTDVTPDHMAYMIYTSGSTGQPKGVMVNHASVVNFVCFGVDAFLPEHVIGSVVSSPISFDATVQSLYVPLFAGKYVELLPEDALPLDSLADYLFDDEDSLLFKITPAHLKALSSQGFAQSNPDVDHVIVVAGEQLTGETLQPWMNDFLPGARFINEYGPTEATVGSCIFPIEDDFEYEANGRGIPIGKPLANFQFYVLDEQQRIQPIGTPGELHIGGSGLARGYFNQPEMTADKFIANPFSSDPDAKMYRTGDRVRWLGQGVIEYIERIDNQVKIRGFRVELDEISSALTAIDAVESALVVERDMSLAAYVVADKTKALPIRQLTRMNTLPKWDAIERKSLPNGMVVGCLNSAETDFTYAEIFEEQTYLKHGIVLKENACIFDVGANTGMASLFMDQVCPGARIYAFEPIPNVFNVLSFNAELYDLNIRLYPCGVADVNSEATFTFYPNNSLISGRYGDLASDIEDVKIFLRDQNREALEKGELTEEQFDELLAQRLQSEEVTCQLRALSDVIRENNVRQIDLLKIDAQKSEVDVLNGIDKDDWPKIGQIIIEVHDIGDRIAEIEQRLESKGFKWEIHRDDQLDGSPHEVLYAIHQDYKAEGVRFDAERPTGAKFDYSDADELKQELHQRLSDGLPPFMVPQHYVFMDKFPLTPNGKFDRKALPSPEQGGVEKRRYVEPTTEIERNLCAIWQEVLKVEQVGIEDDFFAMGGHSLLATRLISLIRQMFKVEVPLALLFECPTVATFAKTLKSEAQEAVALPPMSSVDRAGALPLSFAQQRLWFVNQLEGGNTQYNMPANFKLVGPLDKDALNSAMNTIVERHEVLRTTLVEINGEPQQLIQNQVGDVVRWRDLSHLNDEEQPRELAALIDTEYNHIFDFTGDLMVRMMVVKLSDDCHQVIFNMHHVASDGWSATLLVKEFSILYSAFARGERNPLQPLQYQYADFAHWQRQWLQGEVLQQQLDYWKNQLEGIPQLHNLPLDKPRPAKLTYQSASHVQLMDSKLTAQVNQLCQQQGVTLFMFLQSAFAVLCSRYSNETDIVIGSSVAGRAHRDVEPMIGFFINSLVMRNDLNGNPAFEQLLQRGKATVLDAFKNQHVPFETLVETLNPVRTNAFTPLFQVSLTVNNYEARDINLEGVQLTGLDAFKEVVRHDIQLLVNEHDDEIHVNWFFNQNLFNRDTIERMAGCFTTLMQSIVDNPAQPIEHLNLVDQQQTERQLVTWNETARPYPVNVCLHQLIEEQAALHPDDIAVIFEDVELSYDEFNRQSNQLAHYLIEQGVKPDTLVGLCVERSEQMMIGLLAIMKAGGAYVPLDPNYPKDRLHYMLKDSAVDIVVSQTQLVERLGVAEQHVVCLNDSQDRAMLAEFSETNPQTGVTEDHMAYVIYTSGSTGLPKGVMVNHSSVVNFLCFAVEAFLFDHLVGSVVSSPISFDATVQSLYTPLLAGKYVELLPEDALPLDTLADYLFDDEDALLFKITPTHLKALNHQGFARVNPDAKHVIVMGGELLTGEILAPWANDYLPGTTFINEYGPTEATVGSCVYPIVDNRTVVSNGRSIPIGGPLANAQFYVLDKHLQLCPQGAIGELYIGGAGLARAYLNQPEMSADKFINNPFSDNPDDRLYKSGDLVRWLPEGVIEYIERADNQVKIRGFRVELDEINSAITAHQAVQTAQVLERDMSLVAYVVADKTQALPVYNLAEMDALAKWDSVERKSLPNGMVVGCLNSQETDFTYDEIFKEQTYLKHDIVLKENACVFDVGANTGMASLFIDQVCPGARIFAFEPLPKVFNVLSFNAQLYDLNIRLYPCGIADRNAQETFTFYPHNSLISGRYVDLGAEMEDVKIFLREQNHEALEKGELTEAQFDELLKQRLDSEEVQCQLRTLSEIIEENQVTQIDLLKIDAQKSEVDVLDGINEQDWPKIGQIIIEVHNIGNRIEEIEKRLEEKGYRWQVNRDDQLEGSPHEVLYAIHKDYKAEGVTFDAGRLAGAKFNYSDTAVLKQDLHQQLTEALPPFMVPHHYVFMAKFPLTPSGKIDRKALPAPQQGGVAKKRYVAPQTDVQRRLCAIWQEVLEVDQVGIEDDFFALGGHSLLATRLISQVRKLFKVEVPLGRLFDCPSVVAFAQALESEEPGEVVLPPITIAERGGELPLSFAQQRLWFIDQLENGSTQYCMPGAFKLIGTLDVDAFNRAVKTVLDRHEVLRTVIVNKDNNPHVLIREEVTLPVEYVDISDMDEAQQTAEIERLAYLDSGLGFDLANDVLLRITLIKENEQQHHVLFNMHHIASDGWSLTILVKEFSQLYSAFRQKLDNPLSPLNLQYADYARWQQDWLQGAQLQQQLNYWTEQLADLPQLHNLPLDRPRPSQQSFAGKIHHQQLDIPLSDDINQMCQQHGVTLFMLLQSVFSVFIGRYSGDNDIVIGSPIAGRVHQDTENLIGCFVNTLVLRTDLSDNPEFSALLERNKQVILDGYQHQHVPFETLVETLKPERSLAFGPLFQISLTVQNNEKRVFDAEHISVQMVERESDTTHFDLDLTAYETDKGLYLTWKYNASLFEAQSVAFMADNFATLLRGIVAQPQKPIADYQLVGEQSAALLNEWNQTDVSLPQSCLTELFAEQVANTPEKTAITTLASDEQQQLSFAELDRRSTQWAHYLVEQGVRNGGVVGVYLHRSIDLSVAMLAVLKAAGTFVLLDTDYPESRVQYMLEDSGAQWLLSNSKLGDLTLAASLKRFDMDTVDVGDFGNAAFSLPNITQDSPACLFYTSGSTGNPKGTSYTHKNLINYTQAMMRILSMTGNDTMLQMASVSFDVVLEELLPSWLSGAKLVINDHSGLLSSQELHELIEAAQISCFEISFAQWREWLYWMDVNGKQPPSCLRIVMVGCESITPSLMRQWLRYDVQLIHVYGLTETTITSSTWDSRQYSGNMSRAMPAGKPIDNTQFYVLDEAQQLQPIGVVGELYIGGTGISGGYLNKPEQSAMRFINNPLAADGVADRVYRTGDLVRWLNDGNIEFIGREDDQVKVRGFRIELAEVAICLNNLEQVRETVVLALDGAGGDKVLVAYVVASEESAFDDTQLQGEITANLKMQLAQLLPDYMVPSHFIFLDALPLTLSGKIDKKALPDLALETAKSTEIIEPQNPRQAQLAQLFKEVLGIERLSIDDSFFDLGGHSLLATRLVSLVRQHLGLEVSLRTLFLAPTVETFEQAISELTEAVSLSDIKVADKDAPLVLSYTQQRFWFIDRLEGGSSQYNMSAAYVVRGPLDVDILNRALHTIIERHQVLRTRFVNKGDDVELVLNNHWDKSANLMDLSGLDGSVQEAKVEALVLADSQTPFDLSKDVLLRMQIVKCASEHHVVLFNMHHIASDAWSMGLLINELNQLYRDFSDDKPSSLPEMTLQYHDYAAWQKQWLQGDTLDRQINYWREQLDGAPPTHQLPLDKPRPARQQFNGQAYRQHLDSALVQQVNDLCHAEQVTLFMMLQSAFSVLLSRYSGDTDIVMGSPIAGRVHQDTESLLGCFINALALRSDLSDEPAFIDLLAQNKSMILAAFDHQHLPFELLVETLNPTRSMAHAPIFQVSFGCNTAMEQSFNIDTLELELHQANLTKIKFDLELEITDSGSSWQLKWKYNANLFNPETIEQLADSFITLLGSIVEQPQLPVSRLSILEESQTRQRIAKDSFGETEAVAAECMHQVFERQVELTPQNTALVCESESLTYRELNDKVNQLAHYLKAKGVVNGAMVGLCVDRSAEMMVGLLAVLKAGGAYVPLDPQFPEARLRYIAKDSGLNLVLTQTQWQEQLPFEGVELLCLDDSQLQQQLSSESVDNLIVGSDGQSLAYVIYTSGTTGQPKGVMIEHNGLMNYLTHAKNEYLGDLQGAVVSLPLIFDATVTSLLAPLCCGLYVELLSPGEDVIEQLQDYLFDDEEAMLFKLTPAHLDALAALGDMDNADAEHVVIIGGEQLTSKTINPWVNECLPNCTFINEYGPTETVVGCSTYVVSRQEQENNQGAISIGKPIHNTQLYVLDEHRQNVPVGVVGELYIGGAGLARGYLNQSKLTTASFIEHERETLDICDNGSNSVRLYKTGDKVRWLADGNLQYIGRADEQVKLRGFRIEVGEIEYALKQCNTITEAVVKVCEDQRSDKQLVAYLVPVEALDKHANEAVAVEYKAALINDCKDQLRRVLPEYMVPTIYITLEQLPLTRNGKVDHKALPGIGEQDRLKTVYVAPQDETQSQLCQIWQELLDIEKVGINDNFFDLGGHSLLAIRLISTLRKHFSIELPLEAIFDSPTVQLLAQALQQDHRHKQLMPEITSRHEKENLCEAASESGEI